VLEYEKRELANSEHLSKQVDRHISTLQSLRHRLEARHDLKTRSEEFRQWQQHFIPKKHAVMSGKALDTLALPAQSQQVEPDEDVTDEMMLRATTGNKKSRQAAQELTTVLDSLSRLAELEQRISSLEHENRYDELLAKESPTVNQRTALEFRKKRVPTGTRCIVLYCHDMTQGASRAPSCS
jgi:hypothetical protein